MEFPDVEEANVGHAGVDDLAVSVSWHWVVVREQDDPVWVGCVNTELIGLWAGLQQEGPHPHQVCEGRCREDRDDPAAYDCSSRLAPLSDTGTHVVARE
jgi:hypothetical protein